jgi:DNA-binding transcriptional LysR family regulator
VETMPLPRNEIGAALDSGRIDLAFGFLPTVKDTQKLQLLRDRYIVLLRRDHAFTAKRRKGKALLRDLAQLEFVAVRTHADTLRILELLQLQERLRLTTEHFMVLPSIVKATDLAAIMPRNIARSFGAGYAIVEPDFPLRDFTVSLHWSKRFENDAGNRWLRGVIEQLFRERD